MKLLAIDPGYERLGIAVLEKEPRQKERLAYSDCFQTDKGLPHAERLALIGAELERVIAEHAPEALCLESLYFSKNQTTAIKVAEVRGVILYVAARAGLRVFEYNPMEIKVAVTGYGKSDKTAVIAMVPKLVRVEKKIRYDDEYDAIAVGLTCLAVERFG
jgi:crossover junction endodeoxyribonuclease RuvC